MRKKKVSTHQVRKNIEAARQAHAEILAFNRGYEHSQKQMQEQLQPTKLAAMKEATALVTACHKLLYSLGLIVNESKGFGK